jgi:hypothetical protein
MQDGMFDTTNVGIYWEPHCGLLWIADAIRDLEKKKKTIPGQIAQVEIKITITT